jgi:hypothetical protein
MIIFFQWHDMRFHQSARVEGKINKKSNISKQKLFIIFIFMTDIQLTFGWFSPTTSTCLPIKFPILSHWASSHLGRVKGIC